MSAADHGGEEAVGDALLLVVRLAVGVSVAAVGAPGELGGVEAMAFTYLINASATVVNKSRGAK